MFRMRKMMAMREDKMFTSLVFLESRTEGKFKDVTEETFLEIKQHWNVALKTWFWEKLLNHEPPIRT